MSKLEAVYWFISIIVVVALLILSNFEFLGEDTEYFIALVLSITVVFEVIFNKRLHIPGNSLEPGEGPNARIFFGILFTAVGAASMFMCSSSDLI